MAHPELLTMERTAVCESLRANADLTEKALDFMTDPDQIEESKAEIALWRKAADEIDRLAARQEQRCIAHGSIAVLHGDCPICDLEAAEERLREIERVLTKPNGAITNEWYWHAQSEALQIARGNRV